MHQDTPSPPDHPIASKSSLYDEESLSDLLELHQELSSQFGGQVCGDEGNTSPSLHDAVVAETAADSSSATTTTDPSTWITKPIKEKSNRIRAVASDIDGTVIGVANNQTIHSRTHDAIQRAIEAAYSPIHPLQTFFLATGKTRKGALTSLGPHLASMVRQCPGVYNQGLYCLHHDKVVFERRLDASVVKACEQLMAEISATSATGLVVVGYDGDDLYSTTTSSPVHQARIQEIHDLYGEPRAQPISSLSEHAPGFHKILIYDTDAMALEYMVRPQLEAVATNQATVTQSLPTVLELLPEGCSKALGVKKMCEYLGIDPSSQLLALGDAENDKENLEQAAVGICVGNGSHIAQRAADVVLRETADQGAVGMVLEELLGI
eukprot:Nitzschia sp. Nitz4//scaffold55_size114948//80499//81635//NITZ4_003912-RA/size114948-processed-gene-0.75-mRNA-1//-1//CDS//3329554563//7301//frame0